MAHIRRLAPDGVHRIVEISFSDNADLDAAAAAPDAVIAAYATRDLTAAARAGARKRVPLRVPDRTAGRS